MDKALKLTGDSNLDILKNPFATKNVKRVTLQYEKEWFGNKWLWSGYVYFQNGETSGNQRFEHENFDVIVRQINSFIASLGEQQ